MFQIENQPNITVIWLRKCLKKVSMLRFLAVTNDDYRRTVVGIKVCAHKITRTPGCGKPCGEHLAGECDQVCESIYEVTLYQEEWLWFCVHE